MSFDPAELFTRGGELVREDAKVIVASHFRSPPSGHLARVPDRGNQTQCAGIHLGPGLDGMARTHER